jgi:hypothetical protein
MPIGSVQRDRRRRVLLDDTRESDATAEPQVRARSQSSDKGFRVDERAYTEAALAESHPPISLLLPKKLWVLLLIVFSLVSAVTLVNVLNHLSGSWADHFGSQPVMAFDLIAGRGIVKWLSSFLLIVGALYSAQIYLLRRHRNDDYRGTYRLWGWLTAILLLLSLNATSEFHRLIFEFSFEQARIHLGLQNRVGWLLILLSPAIAIVLRTWIEVRQSRLATFALLLASLAFAVAIASDQQALPQIHGLRSGILESNALLIANISLFLCAASYGRHVYLDSQGLLIEQAKRRAARQQAREAKRSEREQRRLAEKAVSESKTHAKQQQREQERAEKVTAKTAAKAARTEQKTKPKQVAVPKKLKSNSSSSEKQTSSDPARTISEFRARTKEANDSASGTSTLVELQQQLSTAKSGSEKKRIKRQIEMFQHSQRRAA